LVSDQPRIGVLGLDGNQSGNAGPAGSRQNEAVLSNPISEGVPMDLTPQQIRDALALIDAHGWECPAGRDLLEAMLRGVVRPLVRRAGVRGPAADQAEASGWEAAWDVLRRPAVRTAQNPAGMVWVAARRAVHAEVGPRSRPARALNERGLSAHTSQVDPVAATSFGPPWQTSADNGFAAAQLSLDALLERGWEPEGVSPITSRDPGPLVSCLVAGLVEAGWEPEDAFDAVAVLADRAKQTPDGTPATQWRWAALRLGVPEWRARRLAALLVGTERTPGLVELACAHGVGIFDDPAVRAALRSTTRRWSAGPPVWLTGWEPAVDGVPA
jgi:hypothetical protein